MFNYIFYFETKTHCAFATSFWIFNWGKSKIKFKIYYFFILKEWSPGLLQYYEANYDILYFFDFDFNYSIYFVHFDFLFFVFVYGTTFFKILNCS